MKTSVFIAVAVISSGPAAEGWGVDGATEAGRTFQAAVMTAPGRNICLTADYGPDLVFVCQLIEFQGAEHVAVIGDGCCGHVEGPGGFEQVLKPDGAVKKAVLSMNMQVDKRHSGVFSSEFHIKDRTTQSNINKLNFFENKPIQVDGIRLADPASRGR